MFEILAPARQALFENAVRAMDFLPQKKKHSIAYNFKRSTDHPKAHDGAQAKSP